MASIPAPRRPAAFSKRGMLALVLFGFLVFVAMLYFMGSGQMMGSANNGRAHAASKGLVGFAALAKLAEANGRVVTVSRSEADLDNNALLVLTPPFYTDEEELNALIEKRRYQGPTLIILPKWYTGRLSAVDAKPGWVQIGFHEGPVWEPAIGGGTLTFTSDESDDPLIRRWTFRGGEGGQLPASQAVQFIERDSLGDGVALVTSQDRVLVARSDQGIEGGSETTPIDPGQIISETENLYPNAIAQAWRVTVVAEPDLFNNWGLADGRRAALAMAIIDEAAGDPRLPIVFDLTVNGLGKSKNLLTLAFEPPFLAATLCLIMALLLVSWRAFMRFGPALAEEQALAFGKSQLVENGGGVIQRTRRMHLLTQPYARMLEARIARRLGLGKPSRELLDKTLVQRGYDAASPRLNALEQARRTKDILRAARALYSLERTLPR